MSGPVVLITGCSVGGIGYSLCKQFHAKGCRVYATTRSESSTDGLDTWRWLKVDVCDRSSIKTAVDTVISEVGRIDILINNAGCPAVGALLDIDYDQVRRCIETNVIGTLSMSREVAIHMAKQGSGKIVNIGSVTGYASTPWAGVYSLTKAAVHSMSDALRLEVANLGIQVIVVAPGSIQSNFGTAGTNAIKIPEDSLYLSVAKRIYARALMSQGPSMTPTDKFADKVSDKLLRRNPPSYITYGTFSFTFLLFYYLPFFIKDFIFRRRFGTYEVKRIAG